jgi:hypothetical protein
MPTPPPFDALAGLRKSMMIECDAGRVGASDDITVLAEIPQSGRLHLAKETTGKSMPALRDVEALEAIGTNLALPSWPHRKRC